MSTSFARLADLILLAILAGLGAILTVAMVFQYAAGELPCPLCLLERVAMFGVCFGIIRHVRQSYDGRNLGLSLVWGLVLLIVSIRHTLLNIVARPGHAYPGSAVLGVHMPVWSVIIALAVLLTLAATLAAFDPARLDATPSSPVLQRIGNVAALYVIALCLINLVSVILQCGLGACHTTGYALL
ncbi:Disulfide bond formation protein DsbB [Beijerinckiaceae bacterium RH AL1]|nr:disulfide bond formation protein B [Beijerinckiaceae bacterium]VVB48173.1 Disulfide bond formation protein DsbB [Beijerinckiaceae bacterium RH CH11]VVB48251.1 Disulfide bond formation protein DsbB [Beijerinckiaceae bacterium RH AL8]VVC56259.1 Disulfide bond formation protein DsbB [Beijerinckiaceae bacterium RH AL1]